MPIIIALVTRDMTSESGILTDASQIDLFNSRWYYSAGTVILTTIFLETFQSAILNIINLEFISKLLGKCWDQGCCRCNARKTKQKIQ